VLTGVGRGRPLLELQSALKASIEQLPADKPRSIQTAITPLEILSAVAAGVDLVHSCWPFLLSKAGTAFVGAIDIQQQQQQQQKPQPLCLDMREFVHKSDSRPLVQGCRCVTCSDHSRAYVRHLLSTREITAVVLLQLHNLHHFLLFFDHIRASIREDRFQAYQQWCTQQWAESSAAVDDLPAPLESELMPDMI
jgi:queuine tRNA-ribosyltransferase subunit QTRTD1